MNIRDHVYNIICEHMAVEHYSFNDSSSLADDLKTDSLDNIELIMALEDDFRIEILEEDASKFTTVGDIIQYLENTISKN